MDFPHIHTLQSFTIDDLPDLDIAVLGALELFHKEPLPPLKIDMYNHPLVVGSGNAEATGRIIFRDVDAVFASESDYEEKLKSMPNIDGIILISASGEKHGPLIARKAKEYHKHVTLITNNPHSSASLELDHLHPYDEFVFPKNREPFSYNTSTYMGMILAHSGEDPEEILRYITEKIDSIDFSRLVNFSKFYLIVPHQFSGIIRMLHVKFIELFGRNIARDIESSEYVPHATTIAPSDELFICFGAENTTWGRPENRLTIPLPENAGYGAMMAIGYYTIAQIQKRHQPYFKEHVVAYMESVSTIFGHTLSPIVE